MSCGSGERDLLAGRADGAPDVRCAGEADSLMETGKDEVGTDDCLLIAPWHPCRSLATPARHSPAQWTWISDRPPTVPRGWLGERPAAGSRRHGAPGTMRTCHG